MRLTLHTLNKTVSRPSVTHWCSLSQQLLDAPPPHKRRMALWQIDDGHAAARNVKELFCRFRETSFAPAVQDLFSKIFRGETKRCHASICPPAHAHCNPRFGPCATQVEVGLACHRRLGQLGQQTLWGYTCARRDGEWGATH